MSEAARKDLLEKARLLVSRDGTNFTVATLCRENGLSRAQFRRVFPTRTALISALASQVRVASRADRKSKIPRPAKNRLIERRLEFLDVAVKKPIETASIEQLTNLETHRVILSEDEPCKVEPPPLVEKPPFTHKLLPTAGQAFADAISDDTSSSPFHATHNRMPLETWVWPASAPLLAPGEMRKMLDSARASASKAAENQVQQNLTYQVEKNLTMKYAVGVVCLGIMAGIMAGFISSLIRVPQTAPPIVASRNTAKSHPVTVINATGIVSDDSQRRIRNLTEHALKGSASAQVELAFAYMRGDGVGTDPIAAAGWAQLAAAKNEPRAQLILAALYGSGIKPDQVRATQWLSTSASLGNVKAMHNLAIAYLSGSGVQKDMVKAANWFAKAAHLRYRDSAFNLAVLYERGEGVPHNSQEALQWYNVAAAAGDQEAAQRSSLLRFALSKGTSYRAGDGSRGRTTTVRSDSRRNQLKFKHGSQPAEAPASR